MSSIGRFSTRAASRLSEPSAPSMPPALDPAGTIGGSASTTSRPVPGRATFSSEMPLAPGSTRLVESVARIPLFTSFDNASFISARSSSRVDIIGSSSRRGSISNVTGVSSDAVRGT
jgi:hypothetical protein